MTPEPPSPFPTTPGGELSREAYALLAQANLLRMRGQWPDAIEKCMDVMTLAPDNASAQSLLGDIYDNQGHIDDAIQWYRMALDVNPHSPADQLKLGRLLEAKARQLPPQTPAPPAAAPATAPRPPARPVSPTLRAWQQRLSASPDAIIRWAAIGAALLVVLVVAIALLGIRAAPPAQDVQVNALPVVVPTIAPPPDPAGTTPVSPAPPNAVLAGHDPNEAALLGKLQAAPTLTAQSLTVTDAQADPRTGRVTVTFSLPPPAAGTLLRDTLLRGALTVGQAAAQNGSGVNQLTLRCVAAPAPGSAPALLCVADTTAAQIAPLAPSPAPTPAALLAIFSNVWWAASVPS